MKAVVPLAALIVIPVSMLLVGRRLRTWGPVLLLFAISLSPRFTLGELAGDRPFDIRMEDLLLPLLVLLWLSRGGFPYPRRFLLPIAIYLWIAIVSTLIGILMGWIHPSDGVFFFLKEVEYFLIFFFVADSIRDRRQLAVLLVAFLVLGLVDFGWKLAQLVLGIPYLGYGPDSPFLIYEGTQAAAAAMFPFAIAAGLFLTGSMRTKVISVLLMGAFSISLLVTQKRSFIGGVFVLLVLLGLLSMLRLRTWRYVIPVVAALAILAAAHTVVETTFQPGIQARLAPNSLHAQDLAERVQIWQDSLQGFFRNPILGAGKGSFPGRGGAHNFYVLLLADGGILGLSAFIWVWVSVGRGVLDVYRAPPDAVLKWVAASWLLATGFIAVANMFGEYLLTVRPAESYWFLTGVAVGAARLVRARSNTAPDRPRVVLTAAP